MAHDNQLPQEDRNLSTNGASENRKKRLAKLALVLTQWFRKWGDAFPSHEVTKLQVATYLEALDDLTPEQLEIGCREATRTAEQFPKPGHIHAALYAVGWDEQRRERPSYLDESPISAEEREQALKSSEAMRAVLLKKDRELRVVSNPSIQDPVTLAALDAQIERYREWLKQQIEQDKTERAKGLDPLPRAELERLAMYLSRPTAERRKLARSREWTRINTANM